MPTRNLEKIFQAKSIAVIGASPTAGKVGNTVLRNLIAGRFAGPIYPINPKHQSIEGLATAESVSALSASVDLAIICTPATSVPAIVHECGQAGILGLVILTAGFREMSKAGAQLERDILAQAAKFSGMRIIGPNCLGILSPNNNLNASFARSMPRKGRVAFLSQSGALCTSVLDWAEGENIGFSHFVSIGNSIDVSLANLIDYFATDGSTDAIIMYVESITHPREFMSAARAFTRTKPIIAYKAGRFAESAQAAASHTGSMAGVDAVYEAAFARAGIVRVFDVDDMFDCAELLARNKTPRGPRLAIVTNAGGPGVMATDALLASDGQLAELSDATLRELNAQLPAAWSHHNPVDILGDATPDRLGHAVQAVLSDANTDALLVVLSPQAMTEPTQCAQAVVDAAARFTKPILTSWMGGASMQEGIQLLNRACIPTYSTPEKAVRAYMHLVQYARHRETLFETPREMPALLELNHDKSRQVFDQFLSVQTENSGQDERKTLSEVQSKELLQAYGIPVTETLIARTATEAIACSGLIGYPVVLKIFSPDITHKTDVGGVELNLSDEESVERAFERMLGQAKSSRPDATLEGVTVQKMISEPNARELIVGMKRDPVFGAVLLVGAGGTAAELYADRALELPPLNESLARRMIESLQIWPLLAGYRGKPGVDVDQLVELLIRLSYLVADFPQIAELDVNPLLATPNREIALDARIMVDSTVPSSSQQAYPHLAIRPYPDELVTHTALKDGRLITLRPIRPEDEPMWQTLLGSCSQESLHFRFQYSFGLSTHEMASRFCFVDYDRELAIVAELEDNGERKLIGVCRLVADADHREAEYAILVGAPWQHIGLGSLLTDRCLEICRHWSIQSVVADIATENTRMRCMLENRGFRLLRDTADQSKFVRARLILVNKS